jgi:hypothetical protein
MSLTKLEKKKNRIFCANQRLQRHGWVAAVRLLRLLTHLTADVADGNRLDRHHASIRFFFAKKIYIYIIKLRN